MLGKKVVTALGAAGILACGACFLPPLPETKPAPPPVVLDLQGMRTIYVVVEDHSPTPHLEAGKAARFIAADITEQGRRRKLTGLASSDGAHADGTLKVSIVSEEAAAKDPKQTYSDLDFHFQLSAVLTRNDGTVAWSRTHEDFVIPTGITVVSGTNNPWRNQPVPAEAARGLCSSLVERMLSAQ